MAELELMHFLEGKETDMSAVHASSNARFNIHTWKVGNIIDGCLENWDDEVTSGRLSSFRFGLSRSRDHELR